jgi:hypothetical protein
VVDDIGAVERSVDDGKFPERMHRGLHKKRHEAEPHAVLLLEALLVAVAQIDYRLHVDFVEGGEDRRLVLRLHQALRDARPQPGHRHALLRTLSGCARCDSGTRGGLRRGHCRRLRLAFDRAQHVRLCDALSASCAADGGSVHAFLGRELARRRHRCGACRLRGRFRRSLHFGPGHGGGNL